MGSDQFDLIKGLAALLIFIGVYLVSKINLFDNHNSFINRMFGGWLY